MGPCFIQADRVIAPSHLIPSDTVVPVFSYDGRMPGWEWGVEPFLEPGPVRIRIRSKVPVMQMNKTRLESLPTDEIHERIYKSPAYRCVAGHLETGRV